MARYQLNVVVSITVMFLDETKLEEMVTGSLEATFERLMSASLYNITVSAFVPNFPLTSTMHSEWLPEYQRK